MNLKRTLFTTLATFGVVASANAATVVVNIDKVATNDGEIHVRLFSEAEQDGYPKEPTQIQATTTANTSGSQVTFENVPQGTYAIAMFQDINGNGEIDTNFIGKPTEPVGYTGEKQFMKPGYDGAKFVVNGDMEITSTFH